jgi:hypothetical protein
MKTKSNAVIKTVLCLLVTFGLTSKATANQPPVAICHNVTVAADQACSEVSIDNGSYDPEGTPLTKFQFPGPPYKEGANFVTLFVSDGELSAFCSAFIFVAEEKPPACDSAFSWKGLKQIRGFTHPHWKVR